MKTKYTHLILLVLLSLSVKQLYGQSSTFNLDKNTSTFIDNAQIECIYKYTVNAPLRNTSGEKQTEIYNTILQANGSVSKFWDWHSFKKDSIIYSSANELSKDSISKVTDQYYWRVKELFVPVILKNYPKEKITVTDEIIPEDYYYVENKTTRNWVLINDTLTVCGYLCNKAETSFGGRKWTAWYAPEIAITDGPWKLYGLPGLILKAEDSTGIHSFDAVVIRQSIQPIYVAKNILQMRTNKEQFIKNKDAFEKDPEKNISMLPQVQIGIDKNTGIVFVNGTHISVDDLKRVYCPLEFE